MTARRTSGGVYYPLLILGISLFFTLYLVERAIRVPLMFDEATTYLNYISANPLAIFSLSSANNHFLNTVLTKASWALAGNSELALRLPNLLGYLVYLAFSFLILNRFIQKRAVVVLGFLLLSVNPYLLDFFSLSRGYGLSLGLLMAALFFFFSFMDEKFRAGPHGGRYLRCSLVAAGLAVLSNFSLLNVYISLVAIAFVLLVALNSKDRPRPPLVPPVPLPSKKKSRSLLIFVPAAVLFNILVISQDLIPAKQLYEPVTVRIQGLTEPEKQAIEVFRMDLRGQPWQLSYQDDFWKLDPPAYLTAVRFKCPFGLLSKIEQIVIQIGPKTFIYGPADLRKFQSASSKKNAFFFSHGAMSLKRSLIPIFKPVINWKGDVYFLIRMFFILGIAALCVGVLYLGGRSVRQWKNIPAEPWRALGSVTWILALFIAYPVMTLRGTGQFWWGGQDGFIQNTAFSLINNSFYGHFYFCGQERWVLFFILGSLLASSIFAFVRYRQRDLSPAWLRFSLLGILLIASLSTIVQKALLATPYLQGRTAIFFIPLVALLPIFLFDDLSRLKRGVSVASISLLVLLAFLSCYHFGQRANTAMTVEWRYDADKKALLKDLKAAKDKDFADRARISLGIDALFSPSLTYYLKRGDSAWLEVHSVPPFGRYDFYYLRVTAGTPPNVFIKKYPFSENVLLKTLPE